MGKGYLACKVLETIVLVVMGAVLGGAQEIPAAERADETARQASLPPQVIQAERFLAQRGWKRGQGWAGARGLQRRANAAAVPPLAQTGAVWLPLGPTAVQSQSYGLVTGRITALALDPSDATGNTLYVGTTGGGVWRSQNANTSALANIGFIPLTDDTSALYEAQDASISIGALSVQPGGTGVILAGTGDPNDARDSYYGAGIIRSTDGGYTWSLIYLVDQSFNFQGQGFAGFAWSSATPQLVVAALSHAYEGILVNYDPMNWSFAGLYYSTDAGVTWNMSTIQDSVGQVIQGQLNNPTVYEGNAVTSVVWNPVRQMFVAAVRNHGYYESTDGITFNRIAAQPGLASGNAENLSLSQCPTVTSKYCPIFRGTLAVNPQTGDTFAWTVDGNNQDLGIWQDVCAATNGACASQTLTFAQQWNTAALETSTALGTATIANGDYTLALAATPSGQETILFAGDQDLWKTSCPYSQGCAWRNTTNSTTCMSGAVGEYQHALAWNANNPLEIFIGNDSGLWRSTDAIDETGYACSQSDASHFQNLNGSLGSLAEVVSIGQVGATPYTMLAGLGENGIVGVNSSIEPTTDWPEILGGEGGPVAIDPLNSSNWYANNGAGVSIYLGAPPNGTTLSTFNPVLTYSTDSGLSHAMIYGTADVVRDGISLAEEPPYAPAPFLMDPLDDTQLLIATCRVWRGPANGIGWSAANAISPILDGVTGDNDCSGNALIRSVGAMALPVSATLPGGGEVIYVGMWGWASGGATLAGHVLTATLNSATGVWSQWKDVTSLNPITNFLSYTMYMNPSDLDISSIFVDSHDPTGKTVYLTVAGFPSTFEDTQTVFGSTDGGVHWATLMAGIPFVPANSIVVDPQSASTVYVATDVGVFVSQQISACQTTQCFEQMGSGLPLAPVIKLSAAPAGATVQNLVAATYGRGIWTIPLLGATAPGSGPATDTLSAASLTFPNIAAGQLSAPQVVTLTNSGGATLDGIYISVSGPYVETNTCNRGIIANSDCVISVQFDPTAAGYQTGTLTVEDVLRTQTVALSGTGITPAVLAASPASMSFTGMVGSAILPQILTVTNTGGAPLANLGFEISGPTAGSFSIGTGSIPCTATLANGSSCTVQVVFTPTAAGGGTDLLAITSSTPGVAPISVSLIGAASTTGFNIKPLLLAFPIVIPGQSSQSQTVTLFNNGINPAFGFSLSATPPFSLVQNTCTSTLLAGAVCTTGVIFSPSLSGPYTGTLSIASTSLGAPIGVPLSGIGGVPGTVQFQPLVVPFMETGVGLTSSATTVTITNPDSVNSLTSLALAVPAGFKLLNDTCPSTLAPLASCTVGVEFAPLSPGAQNGSLTVTSSALPTGSFMSLSGMGFDFAMTSSGSSTQTVANGQTADYTLKITPLLGSQGVFTFNCGTLPPYSSCTFNPTSEGVIANGTGNVVVEIATGLTTQTAGISRSSAWPVLPLLCGLTLLPFAITRRRRALLPVSLLLVALLVMLTVGVSGCTASTGGLSTPPPPSTPGITPAATYSIPVTALSNGVTHKFTLTLTVD
jgi:hypothetical protein